MLKSNHPTPGKMVTAMYEIKVQQSEIQCQHCGIPLPAVAVNQSGVIPDSILDAIIAHHRPDYPAQQVAAAGWLLYQECPYNHAAPLSSPETDRAALTALYHATDGPRWTRNDQWLTAAPLSEWRGVTVDANGRVIELDLRENRLTGEMPPELGNLAALSRLYLSENRLHGEIPRELGNLSNLQWLALSANILTGEIPRELGNLASLQWLILSANRLHGEIPRWLGSLPNLEWLDLSVNELTGEIPPELGNLSGLQWLDLSWNHLTGDIPPELHNLDGLTELNLGGNQLTGQPPHHIQ